MRRSRGIALQTREGAPAFEFRLSEGLETVETPAAVTRPAAEPITDAEAHAVLARLPPIAPLLLEEPFAVRDASLPPPRTGRAVGTPFPPAGGAEGPGAVETGPLEVLRRMPEGEVPLAPHLSVTFSQPMVALDSHEGLARLVVPVHLTPQPPGEWRWVGTRTLLFEPDGRFPMATDYRVRVASGTRAAGGAVLASDVGWSFSTPPATLLAQHPEGRSVRRDALMLAVFDQRVDPAAVLTHLRVRAGRHEVPVRLASDAEVAKDTAAARLVRDQAPGRVVAFRAVRELPADSTVAVTVEADTPSAEGPRTTAAAQGWGFQTYGPFEVCDSTCGWGWDRECSPGDPWRIEFTNPVDPATLRDGAVTVEPELPGLKLVPQGDTLVIQGMPRGRTTYRVALSERIADTFGQPLEVAGSRIEFVVGPAPSGLIVPGDDFVVLDPDGGGRFPVRTVNLDALRVSAYAVGPEDWPAWLEYLERARRAEPATPPGRSVVNRKVRVAGDPDAVAETLLDLAEAFEGGLGQVVLIVRPVSTRKEIHDQVIRTWVQATRIGLDAFADDETLVAWATDLVDGRPLGDVELRLGSAAARSDASGLARITLGAELALLLVARRGPDVAILPKLRVPGRRRRWWGPGWRRERSKGSRRELSKGWQAGGGQDALSFFVFDDRKVYRPGETVHVKGWLRRIGAGPRGDVEALPPAISRLRWTLSEGDGNSLRRRGTHSHGSEIATGEARIGRLGGFDFATDLPGTINLGDATLHLEVDGGPLDDQQHDHTFQVEEFRRPEFEVKAAASEGSLVVGDAARVTVTAAYYAGGSLPGADVSWRVTATEGRYTPPNRDDFSFGPALPRGSRGSDADAMASEQTLEARTDGSGAHRLRIDLDGGGPPRPHVVRAEATVMDVNRQAWAAGADLLVHPARHYVGLRAERAFVGQGEPIAFDMIVTDLDGLALPGRPVRLRAERLDWDLVDGEWREVPRFVREWDLQSSADPVRADFEPTEGGTWRVVARVADDHGRENETELQLWVAGGSVSRGRDLGEEAVTLVPDGRCYHVGDVAQVLVVAPFAGAEGVMTLRRSGLVRVERFTVEGGTHTLAIPIEDAFIPNVHVQVDLVGRVPRDPVPAGAPTGVAMRPAFASGSLNLWVPRLSRTLELTATPRETSLPPGGETTIDLTVRDAAGRAVENGELAVVVVDEAVLSLTGYWPPNPIFVFYESREAGVVDARLRSHVMVWRPVQPEDLGGLLPPAAAEYHGGSLLRRVESVASYSMAAPSMFGGDEMSLSRAAPEPIRTRTDFAALALFAASVATDAEGRASVAVTLPDSVTRYRVMAVAVSGPRSFGSGEATIVARLPLMVRPSAPRFLNFGDRFELPVVVQNQTDDEMTVEVAVRAVNADLTAGAGRRLVVAANDRAEVRFPMAAARPGRARIQVGAASGSCADAAEAELPVWTPATTEAFATYGQIDGGSVAQPVKAPYGAVPGFGGLDVSTSSTAVGALTDAVLYLVGYPFECSEQLSSRVLGVAALRDVLAAFGAEGLPKPEEIEAAVGRDLERLRGMQNPDGGFGFWRRGDDSWPYVSIHVAHALARARAKGFPVSAETIARSKEYLGKVERHIPAEYGVDVRQTLRAYALSVRALVDDPDPVGAQALVREAGVDSLSFEALGWILPVLSKVADASAEVKAIRRRLANSVSETAAAAHFAVNYGDGAHLLLHSDRRADAILLEALIADSPESDLIPKLVEGLLAHRTAGRWANTQENVFVLLALDRYFGTYEKATPDFVARAWLGERYAGAHEFRGRTTERSHLAIPMAYLRDGTGTNDLVLEKDGPGRLYYRIGLRYAPEGLELAPLDRGFAVERSYEGADDPDDVRRAEDGSWRIRTGARVRVRLTMVAPSRRYHVALVDPLPAGLEPMNPALAVTGSVPGDGGSEVGVVGASGLGGPGGPGHWWWWSRTWFDHQNLRDDRVEAFAALLWEGVHTYAYVAQATTPGMFVVPPPKAEEMYAPETFGRGGTDRVVVE